MYPVNLSLQALLDAVDALYGIRKQSGMGGALGVSGAGNTSDKFEMGGEHGRTRKAVGRNTQALQCCMQRTLRCA